MKIAITRTKERAWRMQMVPRKSENTHCVLSDVSRHALAGKLDHDGCHSCPRADVVHNCRLDSWPSHKMREKNLIQTKKIVIGHSTSPAILCGRFARHAASRQSVV